MKSQHEKRLYWVWADMKSRCLSSRHKAFQNYGGRGISVCERWQSSFGDFCSDMGARPEGGLLDRVDNDGNYSPENCKWSTRKEQNSNRRSCIFVEHDGEQVTLKEACRRRNMSYRAVVKRIQDRQWPVELALSIPVTPGKKLAR